MKIAILGTGLMGSGFVRRLRTLGHEVRVWNRSADKARALESLGAIACDDAAAALAGAERVHVALADDAAVDAVLEPLAAAFAALPAEVWIVDHTTTSVHGTAARAARWAARGRVFVHAPVFMGPGNAAEGSGVMLLAGARAHHDTLAPLLSTMTGKLAWMGEDPSRAAAFKLFGNLGIIGLVALLADINRLAQGLGIATEEAFGLFEHFNPGPTLAARAARVAGADVTRPSFELAMARKDLRLMSEEAARTGAELLMVPAMATLLDQALARGQGGLDFVVAARRG